MKISIVRCSERLGKAAPFTRCPDKTFMSVTYFDRLKVELAQAMKEPDDMMVSRFDH